MGFIKTTDHRPTDHRPTDPPTHQPLTYRPTDQLLLTKIEIEGPDPEHVLHSIIRENFKSCTV